MLSKRFQSNNLTFNFSNNGEVKLSIYYTLQKLAIKKACVIILNKVT